MQKEKLSDVEAVKQSAANPHASLAGQTFTHELGVADFSVTTDGACARLRLGSEETGPLSQADLQVIVKQLNAAIQQTY